MDTINGNFFQICHIKLWFNSTELVAIKTMDLAFAGKLGAVVKIDISVVILARGNYTFK